MKLESEHKRVILSVIQGVNQSFKVLINVKLMLGVLCLSPLPHLTTFITFHLWNTLPKLQLIREFISRQVLTVPLSHKIYIVRKTRRQVALAYTTNILMYITPSLTLKGNMMDYVIGIKCHTTDTCSAAC